VFFSYICLSESRYTGGCIRRCIFGGEKKNTLDRYAYVAYLIYTNESSLLSYDTLLRN
jgi:hypothetical protein